jgi:hypothetical protein
MATYTLTVQEIDLLHQAAGMAGDRLARQENDAGTRVMETLVAQLETRPAGVWLNVAQREVLGKMLMNIAYDLIRADQDAQAETAEALAERLCQDEQDEEDEQGGAQ